MNAISFGFEIRNSLASLVRVVNIVLPACKAIPWFPLPALAEGPFSISNIASATPEALGHDVAA
ncbi:hypothetical protein D3C80_2161580 [compost metagenome]